MGTSRLISENTVDILKAIRIAGDKQVEVQSGGTHYEKIAPVISQMVCTAADLAIDAAKDGGQPSPVTAGIFIINRVTGFAGLSENEKVLCVAALAELATTIAPIVAAGTSEVVTVGASTPISIPSLLVTGAGLTLSAMKVHKQCGPLVAQKINELNGDAFKVYLQLNNFVGNPVP